MTFFACGHAKRCECGRTAVKRCAFPLRGRAAGSTCNRDLCVGCAVQVAHERHYCPPHARLTAHEREEGPENP